MLPRTVSDENKTGTPAFLISVPYTCPECAQGFGGAGGGGRQAARRSGCQRCSRVQGSEGRLPGRPASFAALTCIFSPFLLELHRLWSLDSHDVSPEGGCGHPPSESDSTV